MQYMLTKVKCLKQFNGNSDTKIFSFAAQQVSRLKNDGNHMKHVTASGQNDWDMTPCFVVEFIQGMPLWKIELYFPHVGLIVMQVKVTQIAVCILRLP